MQIEATGKSVEIAIQNGLLECGMKREEVNIKVLDEGGLFKNAKVLLSWGEEECVEENSPNEETKEVEEKISSLEKEESEKIEAQSSEEIEKKKKVVDTTALQERGKNFLLGLAKILDENATVECEAKENEVSFSIKGEKLGKLIGFHGENIQALQLLLSCVKAKGEGAVRVFLDVDGYKANRNQSIIDLANRVAEQAIKIERNIHLDPMNAYDRRIVHTTLQGRDDVTTESTGEGEKRHVVIKPLFK